MTKASRFDPLDMALSTLTPEPSKVTAVEAVQVGERAQERASASPPTEPARREPSVASNRSPRAAPTSSAGRKTQLNVYLRAETADELRRAVLALGQRHSLGDLVARLVDDHLEEVIERLEIEDAAETTPRLRGGRKIRAR